MCNVAKRSIWPKSPEELAISLVHLRLISSLSPSVWVTRKGPDAHVFCLLPEGWHRCYWLLQCPWQPWLIIHSPLPGWAQGWPPNPSRTGARFSHYQCEQTCKLKLTYILNLASTLPLHFIGKPPSDEFTCQVHIALSKVIWENPSCNTRSPMSFLFCSRFTHSANTDWELSMG